MKVILRSENELEANAATFKLSLIINPNIGKWEKRAEMKTIQGQPFFRRDCGIGGLRVNFRLLNK